MKKRSVKAKLKKVRKHLKGDMKMFAKEKAEDKALLKKLGKGKAVRGKAKKKASKRGYEQEEREYVDQLPTEVGGQADEFENTKGLGDEGRVARKEKKAIKVSYKAQAKAKKAAKKKK